MSDLPRNPELERLLGRFVEETLDEESADRLDKLIRELVDTDPAWKSEIWQQVLIDAQLNDMSKGFGRTPALLDVLSDLSHTDHFLRENKDNASSLQKNRKFGGIRLRHGAIALTLFLALIAGGLAAYRLTSTHEIESVPPSIVQHGEPKYEIVPPVMESGASEGKSSAVALLKMASQVAWEDENEGVFQAGQILEPGWMRFHSGIVIIDFFNGASVCLEGPAEFQIVSASKGYCRKGRLVVEVPPQAVGFQIDVPQMNVVDLGTSFSLNVSNKETLVHVLDGEVELHALPKGKELLQHGEAALVDQAGHLDRVTAPATSMASPSGLLEILRQQELLEFEHWKKQSESLLRDPSLLVRFDFLDKENLSRYVPNTASAGRESIPNGLMIDCRIAEGRWKEKGAIEFKRISDRVRFDIPGEMESMTLATWVRVDGLDRRYNALFTSDGFSPGEVHWHIRYRGTMEIGINYSEEEECQQIQTPVLITSERIGEWVHLAAVIDGPKGIVSQYFNGELVHTEALRAPLAIRFKSNTQLGNWTMDPNWQEHTYS